MRLLQVCSLCLATALVLMIPLKAPARTDGFKELRRTRDDITISRRAGRTKGFFETRFDARSPVAPDKLYEKLWKSFLTRHEPVAERNFLKKGESEIVFHDKVKTPVVSDRDYVMQIRRRVDNGVFRIDFHTTDKLGPPPLAGFVRMTLVKGYWQIKAAPDGGSEVRYQVYSEPGGSVPAFIIKEPQVKEALGDFRRALKAALKP